MTDAPLEWVTDGVDETLDPVATNEILAGVYDERARQDARFGEQNHPDQPPYYLERAELYKNHADIWKSTNAARVLNDRVAWDGILLEEVYEALAEIDRDTPALRSELVQVAAVAVAWIEAIDRRESLHA